MTGVLVGFAIIGFIIAVGYLAGRLGILGPSAGFVLNRIAFFVLSPCLLFTVLESATVSVLFSSLMAVSLVAALTAFAVYLAVARFVWHRGLPEIVVGALGAGYVNANNIGIPVAVYVLGSAAYSAPVVLLQLLVFAPVALTILDVTTTGRASIGRILLKPLTNPLIIGSALGVILAVTGWHPPAAVLKPFELLEGAAVPVVLLAFGMSLHGQKLLQAGGGMCSSRPRSSWSGCHWSRGYSDVLCSGFRGIRCSWSWRSPLCRRPRTCSTMRSATVVGRSSPATRCSSRRSGRFRC